MCSFFSFPFLKFKSSILSNQVPSIRTSLHLARTIFFTIKIFFILYLERMGAKLLVLHYVTMHFPILFPFSLKTKVTSIIFCSKFYSSHKWILGLIASPTFLDASVYESPKQLILLPELLQKKWRSVNAFSEGVMCEKNIIWTPLSLFPANSYLPKSSNKRWVL